MVFFIFSLFLASCFQISLVPDGSSSTALSSSESPSSSVNPSPAVSSEGSILNPQSNNFNQQNSIEANNEDNKISKISSTSPSFFSSCFSSSSKSLETAATLRVFKDIAFKAKGNQGIDNCQTLWQFLKEQPPMVFDQNEIQDPNLLSNLPVKTLRYEYKKSKSIEPSWDGLESLEELSLSGEILDFKFIKKLKNLKKLEISGSHCDLTPLGNLSNLKSLTLKSVTHSQWDFLSLLPLESLSIEKVNLEQESLKLPPIVQLSLVETSLKDISFLGTLMPHVQVLNLSNNPIVHIESLENFQGTYLNLSKTLVNSNSFGFLTENSWPNLKELDLAETCELQNPEILFPSFSLGKTRENCPEVVSSEVLGS